MLVAQRSLTGKFFSHYDALNLAKRPDQLTLSRRRSSDVTTGRIDCTLSL